MVSSIFALMESESVLTVIDLKRCQYANVGIERFTAAVVRKPVRSKKAINVLVVPITSA